MLTDILKKFDMPQIYQALSSRPFLLLNPYLGEKTIAGKSDIENMEQLVSPAYELMGKEEAWTVKKLNNKRSE